jgi:hypothetical protein
MPAMKWSLFKFTPSTTKKPAVEQPLEAFHAVEIVSNGPCCKAASEASDVRFLSKEGPPTLPLAACDSPHTCRCRYRHHADRRRESRRTSDHAWSAQAPLPAARERRRNDTGRRATDSIDHNI